LTDSCDSLLLIMWLAPVTELDRIGLGVATAH
jgi:hypothetical protein